MGVGGRNDPVFLVLLKFTHIRLRLLYTYPWDHHPPRNSRADIMW